MTGEELIEQIRVLIADAAESTEGATWHYSVPELVRRIMASLRKAQALNLALDVAFDAESGEVTGNLTLTLGMFLAYDVAATLVSGDMVQKILDGELGLLFKSGTDTIDTKTAAISYRQIGDKYQTDAQLWMTILLSDAVSAENSHFGGQTDNTT